MSVVVLGPLWWLVDTLLGLCIFVVVAAVVMSWLIAFGVLNMSSPVVRQIENVLEALTEPVFKPVRKMVPPVGGLDLSPLFVLLGLSLLRVFFDYLFAYLIYRI